MREIAPGREAVDDKFICDVFREREVMRDDWPVRTSSRKPGPGDGGLEAYWVEVAVAAASETGVENDRVGDARTLEGII